MIIQNFKHSYLVMRHLEETRESKEFFCLEVQEGDQKECLLVEVSEQAQAKNFMLFLEEKIKDGTFSDYLECFWAEGKFYAVFSYSSEQALTEKLKTEYCSLSERAEIARKLLEKLLLLDPHAYFAWNGLRKEQITVSRSLEVQWNYHLEEVRNFERYSVKDAASGIYHIFELLFEQERKQKLYEELEVFMQQLQQGQTKNYLSIYQDFITVYNSLLEKKEVKKEPQTFWFKIWEKLKKVLAVCHKLLMAVLLVLALVYVIFTLNDDTGTKVVSKDITQIGDLKIQ